ncbi:unnamed protein product [Musa textilis]
MAKASSRRPNISSATRKCYRFSSRRGRRKLRETRSSSRRQLVRSKAGTGAKEEGAGSGSAEESADANESEKEGELAPQGLQEQQREEQSLRGFQLHQIHHNRSSYFSSSSSSAATASSSVYACLPERIGEGHSHNSAGYDQLALLHHHHQQQLERPQPRSRQGGARGSAVGEIVEVQGGHIVRSTGRKDRHSKVCTAKGPRDRRVRLSAHTAIQFYDVQDRLGYDRPSKAVDWLMKNAKAAIDELAELPPWSPSATVAAAQAASSRRHPPLSSQLPSAEQTIGESSSKSVAVAHPALSTAFSFGAGGAAATKVIPFFLLPWTPTPLLTLSSPFSQWLLLQLLRLLALPSVSCPTRRNFRHEPVAKLKTSASPSNPSKTRSFTTQNPAPITTTTTASTTRAQRLLGTMHISRAPPSWHPMRPAGPSRATGLLRGIWWTRVAAVGATCSVSHRLRRRRCTLCSDIACSFLRGDPFSPVTRPRFVLGPTLSTPQPTTGCNLRFIHPCRPSDSHPVPVSQGSASRHGSRAKRSTTATTTSRPLLPLLLATDGVCGGAITTNRIPPLDCLVR